MPREAIGMTAEELHTFFGDHDQAVLATLDPDGATWADVVAYSFEGERISFHVPRGSRSLRNLRADPRVCCLVEHRPAGGSYYELKAAMVHGEAVEFDGADDDAGAGPGFSVGLADTVTFAFDKIVYRYEDRDL